MMNVCPEGAILSAGNTPFAEPIRIRDHRRYIAGNGMA
jgi:hypothetical protein